MPFEGDLNPMKLIIQVGSIVYSVIHKRVGRIFLVDVVPCRVYGIRTTGTFVQDQVVLDLKGRKSDGTFYVTACRYTSLLEGDALFVYRKDAEEYADNLYEKLNQKAIYDEKRKKIHRT